MARRTGFEPAAWPFVSDPLYPIELPARRAGGDDLNRGQCRGFYSDRGGGGPWKTLERNAMVIYHQGPFVSGSVRWGMREGAGAARFLPLRLVWLDSF